MVKNIQFEREVYIKLKINLVEIERSMRYIFTIICVMYVQKDF